MTALDGKLLRISALYERDDVEERDGLRYVPLSALAEILAQAGLTITYAAEGHGAQGEPATGLMPPHETALGSDLIDVDHWKALGELQA